MSENLKPCPCCGGPAIKSLASRDNHVFCHYCGLRTKGYKAIEDAIADWQERTDDPLLDTLWAVVHAVCNSTDVSSGITKAREVARGEMAAGDDEGWLYMSAIADALEGLEKAAPEPVTRRWGLDL